MSGGGNPYHDDIGRFAEGPGGGSTGDKTSDHAVRGTTDNAVVNIPLSKRGDLNAQIDKWKKNEAVTKQHERAAANQNKMHAKAMLAEHGPQLVAKYGPKLGPKLDAELKRMAHWEPTKFLKMVETFKAGK